MFGIAALRPVIVYTQSLIRFMFSQRIFLGYGMTSELAKKKLLEARKIIDEIDSKLVDGLSERFSITHKVGLLKAEYNLDAVDKTREARKLAEIRALCEGKNLDPDFVEELFGRIMEEVVKNHRNIER